MRTWSNSTFETALDSSKRNQTERQFIVNELFDRFEKLISESPENYAMDYVHVIIHAKKIKS